MEYLNVYDNKTNEIEVICLAALKEKNIQPQITYKKNDKTGFNDAFWNVRYITESVMIAKNTCKKTGDKPKDFIKYNKLWKANSNELEDSPNNLKSEK